LFLLKFLQAIVKKIIRFKVNHQPIKSLSNLPIAVRAGKALDVKPSKVLSKINWPYKWLKNRNLQLAGEVS